MGIDIGVTTESLNRLPVFEPTRMATYKKRVFEGKNGKLIVEGHLGQVHKNLLETILFKQETYSFSEYEGKKLLQVRYDEYKVEKYLSKKSRYSQKGYQRLIEDMKQSYIELETNKIKVKGTLILEKNASKITRMSRILPNRIRKEIPYAVITFGSVLTELFEKDAHLKYDPKPIIGLRHGISQALVRFLLTNKNHPQEGYNLKALLERLEGQIENKRWWRIIEYLKKDAETLEKLGIVINFKENKVFVIDTNMFNVLNS